MNTHIVIIHTNTVHTHWKKQGGGKNKGPNSKCVYIKNNTVYHVSVTYEYTMHWKPEIAPRVVSVGIKSINHTSKPGRNQRCTYYILYIYDKYIFKSPLSTYIARHSPNFNCFNSSTFFGEKLLEEASQIGIVWAILKPQGLGGLWETIWMYVYSMYADGKILKSKCKKVKKYLPLSLIIHNTIRRIQYITICSMYLCGCIQVLILGWRLWRSSCKGWRSKDNLQRLRGGSSAPWSQWRWGSPIFLLGNFHPKPFKLIVEGNTWYALWISWNVALMINSWTAKLGNLD